MQAIVVKSSSLLQSNKRILGVAESCTGGLLAKLVTDLPGSSQWFDCGFITYSNAAKIRAIGVMENTLLENGAVSESVVIEMAQGVLANSDANVSLSISGIAGPDGGTNDKPVGTVYIACCVSGDHCVAHRYSFSGDRNTVRKQAAMEALKLLNAELEKMK